MRRGIRTLLLALAVAVAAQTVLAQELRVRAESAAIHAEPSAQSRVIATVAKGATLVVVREAGEWWLVRHGSTGSQGYVRKSAVEASSGAPAASPSRPSGPAQGAKPAGPAQAASPKKGAWTDLGWVALNGLYQNSSASFGDGWSWALNAETARATASYALKSGVAYGGEVGFRLWRNLGVGLGASYWSLNGSGQVAATLPHPLYLRRDRPVAGSLEARRQETAAHLQVAWVAPVGRRVLVTIGAGPSYFTVKQDLADLIRYGESYPFDQASFTFAETRTASKSAVGFNAGIDVGYFFTTTVGVGVVVRYTGATASLAGTGTRLSLKAGGLQAGLGLRVRIPKGTPKPPAKPAPKPPAKPAPKT